MTGPMTLYCLHALRPRADVTDVRIEHDCMMTDDDDERDDDDAHANK